MKSDEGQLIGIMQALRERAKELNCLYRVDDLLNENPDRPFRDVLRGIVDILPHGWQYVDICKARIVLENVSVEPEGFRPSPWTQSARIIVEGEPIGTIEIVYGKAMPHADEGPFLKEERKLIETVAERIASSVIQRRLKAAYRDWVQTAGAMADEKREWRVVLEFLRDTDPVLLKRISRK